MELHQIYVIGLQPFQGLVELLLGRLFGSAVQFGHQEHFGTVAVLQGFAHALLALALVVIPTVVQKRDAPVYGGTDQGDALLLVLLLADVEPAHADEGYLLPRASQRPVQHIALTRGSRRLEVE